MNKAREQAIKLRDQIMKTWSPPEHGRGRDADIVQTAAMCSVLWCFPDLLPDNLTPFQKLAISQGLELWESVLNQNDNPEP